ncbi:MAG: hypothetical protein DDT32_01304 [Syntrophomonadaceae bacterium]|nr:hypothetical protein [Bacillota bacterium]
MFVRTKSSGKYIYLQIVENSWEKGKVKQRVIATLGRLDQLQMSLRVDGLIKSLARFAEKVKIIEAYREGNLEVLSVKRLGPSLTVGRLWQELAIDRVLKGLLTDRKYGFALERAIYFTVLSRLFFPGSDRKALRIGRDYLIEGLEGIKLHHLYRSMHWLGQVKEEVELNLFKRNRSLFNHLNLVFFDTTSIYFTGEGGETLGRYGYSRDRRPEEKQMIVGVVMDATGRPLSCPMWPGNTADALALREVLQRLKDRFGVGDMAIVADRGMVSKETISWLEASGTGYILGTRMRREKEVLIDVLGRAGRYQEVGGNLQVKEVRVEGKRYILCFNPEEAERDALGREVLIETLRGKIQGDVKALVGNRAFRRYLRIDKSSVEIAEEKIKAEERFDGKYVLRTNLELPSKEIALRYKDLWQVERIFRELKEVLQTRPVYHKYDLTIEGHVFCSFLALIVMKELMRRVNFKLEWEEIKQDLTSLYTVGVLHEGKKYLFRSPLEGSCAEVLKSLGIAIPPSVIESPT